MKKIKLLVFSLIVFLCFGVINVSALGTENIDSKLTNGKLILKSIPPSSISDPNMKEEAFIDAFVTAVGLRGDYSCNNCNETFTSCTMYYKQAEPGEEEKVVTIEYVYDKQVKNIIDGYLTKLNEGKSRFIVKDLEIVNYWINNNGFTTLLSFSEEYKSYFEYKNFIPYIDVRGGGGSEEFTDSNIGIAKLKYNDTLYFIKDGFGAFTKNIIYVPTDTDNEDVLEVVTNRIEDYIGEGNTISIEEVNTVEAYINGYISNAQALDEADFAEHGYDNNYYESALKMINTEEGELHFLRDANIAPNYYEIVVNGNVEKPYYFVVIKDSSKMQIPKFKTSDVSSDISISALNKSIPLDTLIKVNKITSGENYDTIMKILKATNSEMFDLKLFSQSTEDYITQLEDGSFEVRIPISESYKEKDLIVYFVDDNQVKHDYPVTIDGKYAVFNTNHFSIYTLVATDKPTEENPKTGDSIMKLVLLGSISLIGLLGVGLYIKKKKFN